jgi:hypothetical protein
VSSKTPPRSRRYFYIFCLIFACIATLLAITTTRTLMKVHESDGAPTSSEEVPVAERAQPLNREH